jgi:drug/metabolite transporter (DMT)-like permease
MALIVMQTATRPRWQIVLLLMLIACVFGSNHVAARVAFDHGTSVMLAVVVRSTFTSLALLTALKFEGVSLSLPKGIGLKLFATGILLTIQSLCIYSAVAIIPVGLALLTFNTFPFIFALLSWLIEGRRPSNKTLLFMPLALVGLSLALNLFDLSIQADPILMVRGIILSLTASVSFAVVMLVTQRWLVVVDSRLRSLCMMSTVVVLMGALGLLRDGFALPQDPTGWGALVCVAVLYSIAIISFFVFMPRFGMLDNAAVMNFEPVAALIMGIFILDQTIRPVQTLGVVLVFIAMVGFALQKRT